VDTDSKSAPPNVIILNAGQGRRLLPLTEETPKCLIDVGGRSMVGWQLEALSQFKLGRVTVVVGFGAEKVEQCIGSITPPSLQVSTIFNPDYDKADNLISCWAARAEMETDFLLLNGDTLFRPTVLARLLSSKPAPVTVTIDRKPTYDADDMKVQCDGAVLRRIGKDVPLTAADAEAIGILYCRGNGARLFREGLGAAVAARDPDVRWYLSVVDRLAKQGAVEVASVEGLEWIEIDDQDDLRQAARLVASW
jgi:choline kinase